MRVRVKAGILSGPIGEHHSGLVIQRTHHRLLSARPSAQSRPLWQAASESGRVWAAANVAGPGVYEVTGRAAAKPRMYIRDSDMVLSHNEIAFVCAILPRSRAGFSTPPSCPDGVGHWIHRLSEYARLSGTGRLSDIFYTIFIRGVQTAVQIFSGKGLLTCMRVGDEREVRGMRDGRGWGFGANAQEVVEGSGLWPIT
jgi:hypothetical protein